jgi:imidazole glycerol-phosphate synthase subunit HisH
MSIAVIDYGMGNLHSISKALQHVTDDKITITHDHDVIMAADRVVLPGVGGMRDCMAEMKRLGVDKIAEEAAQTKPFLGICIGMQAMMSFSDENSGVDCLNWFNGKIHHFSETDDGTGENMKVPHMGWNQVKQTNNHPMWHNIPDESRFYFVHSYYLPPKGIKQTMGTTDYADQFVAALGHENIFAVQFHPEKSQKAGLQLLKNFAEWQGQS